MNFCLLSRTLLLIMFFCLTSLFSDECCAVSGNNQLNFVPLGVYMSWERPIAYAKYYKIDKWTDICRRLDIISANNVDTLWVANMTKEDFPRLIAECEKRGLKLLVGMSEVELKIKSRWANAGKYYDELIPEIVKLAANSESLVGWVLSDEPGIGDLPKAERLRRKFQQFDPKRFCLIVTVCSVTPHVPEQTKFPVVCVDLYPFFGPNDPNGPHTDKSSKAFFRKNAQRMIRAIGDKNIFSWIMSQCFVEVWGPWKYDRRFHVIALPGAYMHWRCPTLAEIRWQIWETFRSGSKGAFIFTVTPPPIKTSTENLPPPKNFAYKNVLAKEPVDIGPGALLNPDASITPQMKELSKIYKTIAKYKSVIKRWKRINMRNVKVSCPGQMQGFIDSKSKMKYVIILNDDLHKAHKLKLTLPGNRVYFYTLEAGEGKIIKID